MQANKTAFYQIMNWHTECEVVMNTEQRQSDVMCCWCFSEGDAAVWAFCLFVLGKGGGFLTQIRVCTLATEAIDVPVTLTKIVLVVNATFL